MSEYRVLVCGGRDYADRQQLFEVLDEELSAATVAGNSFILIHGGARGADSLSGSWAAERQVSDVRVYEADWNTYGRAAGAIRNRLMLTDGQPHVIVAFKGGKGTANMIQQGKKAGVPVKEIM